MPARSLTPHSSSDSEGYLNLLLTRPAKDGMITLRQTTDSQFIKTPAIPALRRLRAVKGL